MENKGFFRKLKIFAITLFLLHFCSPEIISVTRLSIYESLMARRTALALEIKELKVLQTEIKGLQQKITSAPFDEAARADYSKKISEGKTRSEALRTKVTGYYTYLKFVEPAFRTQGTGWANLFYLQTVPNIGVTVASPTSTINNEFQDASNTYPIPAFPSAPTISIKADKTNVAYGGEVNLQATTTGSGTLTITWETTAGTLSASQTMETTLTAPTGQATETIEVKVTATVKNQKDSAKDEITITVTPTGSDDGNDDGNGDENGDSDGWDDGLGNGSNNIKVNIVDPSVPGTQLGWEDTCELEAAYTDTGNGTTKLHWFTDKGSLSPKVASGTTYTAPQSSSESTITTTVVVRGMSTVDEGFSCSTGTCHSGLNMKGSISPPAKYLFKVGSSSVAVNSGQVIEDLGGSGEIEGDLTGE
ncbi:hypothetical protein ACFL35_07415 [Candidatus Riflebacteria bacterium]